MNAVFLVHPNEPKVALVYHLKLDGWFAPGGHVELDEDPDAALRREVLEEVGFAPADYCVHQTAAQHATRAVVGALGRVDSHGTRPMFVPWALEVHNFVPVERHYHIALVYLARAFKAELRLEEGAHREVRWFSAADLDDPAYAVAATIKDYGRSAIRHYYPDA